MIRVIFVMVLPLLGWSQVVPENSCPDIFKYVLEKQPFYGLVTVPNDGSDRFSLSINVSMSGIFQNAQIKLESLTPIQDVRTTQRLRYKVSFPFPDIIPKITQIVFNDKLLCTGTPVQVGTAGATNLWANIVVSVHNVPPGGTISTPYDIGLTPPTFSANQARNQKLEDHCGISNSVQELVLKGTPTQENEFPWLVAMFARKGVSYDFQCTANLISNKHVITAAHCVRYYKATLIQKEDILLVLGRSDLRYWASNDAIVRTANDVIPHPSYQQGTGNYDVAVISLNKQVTYVPTIRPICLWTGDSNLEPITDKKGVVAGWGKSEEAEKVPLPKKVSMPVVSQDTCLLSKPDFRKITSNVTFCAGSKDGGGPCSGDSGAGFVLQKDGRWYLRGIVSTALKDDGFSCNLNEYVVFADVAKLKDWIKTVLV